MVAALNQYGLVDSEGQGPDRMIRLSDLGFNILVYDRENLAERKQRIREAALRPVLFKELWEKYQGRLPSDASIAYEMERTGAINKNVIGEFLSAFRATIAFADLDKPSGVPFDVINNVFPSRGPADKFASNNPQSRNAEEQEEENVAPAPTKSKSLPATASPGHTDYDLSILLLDGGQATLRIPIPISPEGFDQLVKVLTFNLDALRPAMIRGYTPPKENSDPPREVAKKRPDSPKSSSNDDESTLFS